MYVSDRPLMTEGTARLTEDWDTPDLSPYLPFKSSRCQKTDNTEYLEMWNWVGLARLSGELWLQQITDVQHVSLG